MLLLGSHWRLALAIALPLADGVAAAALELPSDKAASFPVELLSSDADALFLLQRLPTLALRWTDRERQLQMAQDDLLRARGLEAVAEMQAQEEVVQARVARDRAAALVETLQAEEAREGLQVESAQAAEVAQAAQVAQEAQLAQVRSPWAVEPMLMAAAAQPLVPLQSPPILMGNPAMQLRPPTWQAQPPFPTSPVGLTASRPSQASYWLPASTPVLPPVSGQPMVLQREANLQSLPPFLNLQQQAYASTGR